MVDQFESKQDAHLWEAARTLDEMGELTARWLEGTVAFCPSQPCEGPDWETTDLVPVLAGFNRSGLVTTGSQPGEEVLEVIAAAVGTIGVGRDSRLRCVKP